MRRSVKWNEMKWIDAARYRVAPRNEKEDEEEEEEESVKWKEQTSSVCLLNESNWTVHPENRAEETLKRWLLCRCIIFNYKSNFKSIEFHFISFFVSCYISSLKQKHPQSNDDCECRGRSHQVMDILFPHGTQNGRRALSLQLVLPHASFLGFPLNPSVQGIIDIGNRH